MGQRAGKEKQYKIRAAQIDLLRFILQHMNLERDPNFTRNTSEFRRLSILYWSPCLNKSAYNQRGLRDI